MAHVAALCAALAASGSARSDADLCRAQAGVEPAEALVGQQIIYRVRIERRDDVARVDWVQGLAFPGFRAEWLPGRAEDLDLQHSGRRYHAREEHRAIFPARSGSLEIPAASLRCTLEREDAAPARTQIAEVPALRLSVSALPLAGRPAGFDGLVGPLQVRMRVAREVVSLGESVAVSVSLRGGGNLWDARAPFQRGDFPDAEVFLRPSEVDFELGESLQVRRYFRLDIVPHRTGVLRIPDLAIPYYDPERGRYAVARADPVEVRVAPRQAATSRSEPSDTPSTLADRETSPTATRTTWLQWTPWLAGLALAVAALTGAVAAWRARVRLDWSGVRAALAEAEAYRAQGDVRGESSALARALREALAVARPELAGLEVRTLVVRASEDPPLLRAVSILEELERQRFSEGDPEPDGEAAAAAVESLHLHARSLSRTLVPGRRKAGRGPASGAPSSRARPL